MDFIIGGLAGAGATVVSNPIEVVKTRLQLQGELKSKMETTTLYRGIFHGIYVIAKNDGILALQKGLLPALMFGSMTNSVRLGIYHIAEVQGWTKSKDGELSVYKAILCSATGGILGGMVSNPMAVLRTRLHAASHPSIAVGRQHKYEGMFDGAMKIYKTEGLRGYFAGVPASCARMAVGSSVQLSTYSTTKEALLRHGICTSSPLGLAFTASAVSGVMVAVINCPLDVITVRLYNQGSGSKENLLYKGLFDCLVKIYKKEGLYGFFKGVWPFYLRVAPHTTICLGIWDMLNNLVLYNKSKNFSY